MKHYDKKYEDVFSGKRALGRLNWDQITISDDEPTGEWEKRLRNLVRENELRQFDFLVKFNWLCRRFKRLGASWIPNGSAGAQVSMALGVWAKNYGNFNFLSVTNNYVNKKIFTYFENFFPDFEINDPFKNKYEYPYQHMGFSHLMLVYQMPERLELLQHGDDHKMSYAKFADWVVNYINCYNDEYGETYEFKFSTFFLPYIKFLRSTVYERRSRGYKRRTVSDKIKT